MGELAEYILNGDDCQECGQYIGDGDGFPRSCSDCQPQPKQRKRKRRKKRKMSQQKQEAPTSLEQALVDINFLKEDRARYSAYHQTEKTMRENAEADLSKFNKIFGRIYWRKG